MSAQQYALVLLPKFSGAISMTFSCLILYRVINKRKRNTAQVYDRLIMGMSMTDLLGSFWMFMGSWPIPKSSGVLWATGNQQTCNLQGFFTQGATIASAIYNASLTFYFVLVLLRGWKRPRLEQYEWCFHLAPWGWGMSTGLAGIFLKIYNNANLWCFIAESPDPDRGYNANFFRMFFFYGPLYIMILIVTINALLVVWYVQKVTTRALRHTSHRTTSTGSNSYQDKEEEEEEYEEEDDEFLNDVEGTQSNSNSTQNESSRLTLASPPNCRHSSKDTQNRYAKWRQKVARQNLRYAMAFYWTWLPISMVRMLQIANHKVPFWLICIACVTTPMQGLPNLLVYFYPKYVEYRKRNKERLNVWRWIQAGILSLPPSSNDDDDDEETGRGRLGAANQKRITDQSPQQADSSTSNQDQDVMPVPHDHDSRRKPQEACITCVVEAEAQYVVELNMSKDVSDISVSEMEPMEEVKVSRKKSKNLLTRVSSLTLTSDLETIDETEEIRNTTLATMEQQDTPLRPPNRMASDNSLRGVGRKVSFSEELSVCDDSSESSSIPELPRQRGVSWYNRLSSPTSILKKTPIARRHSTDSMPSMPLRPASANEDSDEEEMVAPAPAFHRQTSTSSDSMPSMPLRPVSVNEDSDEEDQIAPAPAFHRQTSASSDSSPAVPRRLESETEDIAPAPAFQRQTSASSDASPAVPRRLESEVSEIEDCEPQVSSYQNMVACLETDAMQRQTSISSDTSPCLPSRPVSEVSLMYEDSDDDSIPAFPKPLEGANRQTSISSDARPSLPRRSPSECLLSQNSDDDSIPASPKSLDRAKLQASFSSDASPSLPKMSEESDDDFDT